MRTIKILLPMLLIWQITLGQGQARFRNHHYNKKQMSRKGAFFYPHHGKYLRWKTMPHGAVCVSSGRKLFFYDGRLFQRQASYFLPFVPAPGFFIPVLPGACFSVGFNGRIYHCMDGCFYKTVPGGFVCVDPPIGICIPNLPPGETEFLEQDRLFRFRNQIWRQVVSGEEIAYELFERYSG